MEAGVINSNPELSGGKIDRIHTYSGQEELNAQTLNHQELSELFTFLEHEESTTNARYKSRLDITVHKNKAIK